jgi:hypothetical protein
MVRYFEYRDIFSGNTFLPGATKSAPCLALTILLLSLLLITRCDFVKYGQGMQKTHQYFFM